MAEQNVAFWSAPRVRQMLKRLKHRQPVAAELTVQEAYRRWAPNYSDETAISALDEEFAKEMLSGLSRGRLLDVGCGIGRRIEGVPDAIGMDVSPEMVSMAKANNLIVGDVRDIPFASNSFDMVWCRLVLGHVKELAVAYRELHRVCKPGGFVFTTDFHKDAVRAGHRRTGTDEDGNTFEIEHYVHLNHEDIAAEVGLESVLQQCGTVGPSIRSFYLQGIGEKAYKRDLGLKVLDAFLFEKVF
jgi:malonyl-CoA O-methyltransferase